MLEPDDIALAGGADFKRRPDGCNGDPQKEMVLLASAAGSQFVKTAIPLERVFTLTDFLDSLRSQIQREEVQSAVR